MSTESNILAAYGVQRTGLHTYQLNGATVTLNGRVWLCTCAMGRRDEPCPHVQMVGSAVEAVAEDRNEEL